MSQIAQLTEKEESKETGGARTSLRLVTCFACSSWLFDSSKKPQALHLAPRTLCIITNRMQILPDVVLCNMQCNAQTSINTRGFGAWNQSLFNSPSSFTTILLCSSVSVHTDKNTGSKKLLLFYSLPTMTDSYILTSVQSRWDLQL